MIFKPRFAWQLSAVNFHKKIQHDKQEPEVRTMAMWPFSRHEFPGKMLRWLKNENSQQMTAGKFPFSGRNVTKQVSY